MTITQKGGRGGGSLTTSGSHVSPNMLPIRHRTKPITKPPSVKIELINEKTSTRIDPVLTVSVFSEYIIRAPIKVNKPPMNGKTKKKRKTPRRRNIMTQLEIERMQLLVFQPYFCIFGANILLFLAYHERKHRIESKAKFAKSEAF